MRLTTGGIGVDKVSITLTNINVYGNDKFAAWTKGGVVVHKVLRPGDDQMTIVLSKGVKRKPNEANLGTNGWSQALTQPEQKLLPKFGLTAPVGIELVGDKLNIVIPAQPKRAKLLRGHNKATQAQMKSMGVSTANTAAEAAAATPPAANSIERMMRDVAGSIPPYEPPSTDPLLRVRQLIEELNALREHLGPGVLQSYPTANGSFKATVTFT